MSCRIMPCHSQFVDCIVVMRYGDDFATWDADEKEECKRYRYAHHNMIDDKDDELV